MWKFEDIQKWSTQALINGKWVPARPENYKPSFCSLWKRFIYAWQVIRGKAETFIWPENQ